MTRISAKYPLPLLPHPDHLRKQAKARLAILRERLPSTRLAEAQSLIAKEYGFANWGALKAEVARRNGGRGQRVSLRRADLTPRHALRSPDGGLSDRVCSLHTPPDFLRMGMMAQVGFIIAALSGLALVFVPMVPPHRTIAMTAKIWLPLAQLTHRIL